MKIGTFRSGGRTAVALVLGGRALPLDALAAHEPRTYGPLAQASDVSELWDPKRYSLLASANAALSASSAPVNALTVEAASLAWLAPVIAPEKIICIGLNYRDHAAESGMKIPTEPVFFNKFNNALTGAGGPVVIPSNSTQVDYEAELAVILRSRVKRVSPEDAMGCVAGYTILHDVSARDWQFRTGQWISGKTFDTFAPCGPWMVTPDEISDPHDLSVRLTLNGKVMQDSSTSNLIFRIPELISYLSHIFTLEAGDIISTGTPPGVGFARKPPVFLAPGDIVEISVSGIGVMKHSCVRE
jgi:2-keto-4-pentenoate hydratase/2-oxohepta-3-ene-1,7-dioic acid hydratase in catechol pathway